ILTFQNHTNRPLTDFGGKTSIFSHPVYLFLREFSLQDFRGGSICGGSIQRIDNIPMLIVKIQIEVYLSVIFANDMR
ncbi:hypothetical protein NBU61_26475, partial [Escherichia coli]|uniref:hypothetical protein n=1 Tax=Escherichia coli TaxID=562 RepID=UPI002480F909